MKLQIPGYRIVRKINTGGMASVYLAIQESVKREVALKVMKPQLDEDPQFHLRFKREAEIVGQLSHPNIIAIYDIGRVEHLNYISMDYLPNGSLEEKIKEGMAVDQVLAVVMAIAHALGHLHAKGYIHRDVKPENILFRGDGSPVLTDFGIARTVKVDNGMTQEGNVIGTPYYMSPEQSGGKTIDGMSDLYSLGVMFYEMLTGKRPFEGDDSIAIALQHIQEPIPKLPIQFFAYQPILDKLLAKRPEHRYQSAQELIASLQQLNDTGNHRLLVNTTNRNTTSIDLFKAMFRLVAKDFQYYGSKFRSYVKKLYRKLVNGDKFSNSEINLLDVATNPDLVNAATSIYKTTNVPYGATGAEGFLQKKMRWIYLAFAIGLVSIVAVLLPEKGHKPSAKSQWASLVKPTSEGKQEEFAAASESVIASSSLLSLTINAKPDGARVRILNIPQRYTPGIMLPPGRYQIEVSAPGYKTHIDWIELNQPRQLGTYVLDKRTNDESAGEKNDFLVPEMVAVTASTFVMGDPATDKGKNAKKVTIKNNFYIGKYEITFDEYASFVLATNRSMPEDNSWGGGRRPVINVSWDDAQAYTRWLSKITGERYRLPTEMEWEFAARGNTTSVYWWGNNESDAINRANCRFGCRTMLSGLFNVKSEPVGSFPPNDFGLHDTAGNVAEWVDDCADLSSDSARTVDVNAVQCLQRIVRGGSMKDGVKDIASHAREIKSQRDTGTYIGFRVVLEKTRTQNKNILQRIFSGDR